MSENLDMSYQKVEDELTKNLSVLSFTPDQQKIQGIIDKFMKKHLIKGYIFPKYTTFEYLLRNLEKLKFHFVFKRDYYSNRYYKCYDRNEQRFRDTFRSDLDRIYSNDLEYFIYPHSDLYYFWYSANMRPHSYLEKLERISPEPLNKALVEKWDKARFLYKKLEELKDDEEKWFKCLQEWGDEEFVIHSTEYKIGENLNNKALWKLYIEFWRPKNPKIMVGIYSRYCSFFLDDLEMKEEYKKEAGKLGIGVGDEVLLLDYKEFRSFPSPTLPSLTKSVIPKTNFDVYFRPSFPFHNSFINYLMDNCKPVVLQKLFKSCKYFFKKRPTPICHRLIIAKDQRFDDEHRPNYYFTPPEKPDAFIFDKQALTIAGDRACLKDLKKLYLSNSLHIAETIDNEMLKKIIPKIYESKIKYLTIENQTIELDDYIFLTKSGTVTMITLHKSKINNSDGGFAFLEDVMETLPNANFIDLQNWMTAGCQFSTAVTIDAESFKRVAAMRRNTKLYFFGLGGCDIEAFNANDFFEFMKINIIIDNRHSQFAVHFGQHENGADILKTIVDTLTDLIKAFEIPRKCFSSPGYPGFSIFPFYD